jgi:hypothetical protein
MITYDTVRSLIEEKRRPKPDEGRRSPEEGVSIISKLSELDIEIEQQGPGKSRLVKSLPGYRR